MAGVIAPTGKVIARKDVSTNNVSDDALKTAKKDNKDHYKEKGYVNVKNGDGKEVTVMRSGWIQNDKGEIVKGSGFGNRFQRHRGAFYAGGAVLGVGALYGGYQMMKGDDPAKAQDPTQGQSMQGYA